MPAGVDDHEARAVESLLDQRLNHRDKELVYTPEVRRLELETGSDDKEIVEATPTIVLWFILAIVAGYFTGRTVRMLDRSDRD